MTEAGSNVRMAGYLEKRGKLKLMGSWKKYWFVLEGQLLLYYKSQLEYINLSACRGSLNIGLASCVRPGQGLTIQVVTRTQCTTLRSKERMIQEQWLQALLDSMALPNTSSLKRQFTGPQHFRYSLDNLPAINEGEESLSKECEKKTTLPRRVSRGDSMLFKIRRMGGISYGGNSESIIPSIPRLKVTSDKKSNTIIPEVYKKTSEDSIDREDNEVFLENEDSSEEPQSKEKFRNNLETIRDLLEQTRGMEQTDSLTCTDFNCNQEKNKEPQESQHDGKLEEPSTVENKCSTKISEEPDSSTESIEHSETSDSTPPQEEQTEILTTAQIHDENQKSVDTMTENKLYQFPETMKENTYCYESLQMISPGQEGDEEDHYSSYDRFALMQNLLNVVEPALPPRPDHDHFKSTTRRSNTTEKAKGKSEKKHVFMDKIHQLLKKTPSKEKEPRDLPVVVNCQECRGEIVIGKEESNDDVESEEDYYSCYDRFAIVHNGLEDVEPTLPPRPDHELYKSASSESDVVECNGERPENKRVLMSKIHQLLKLTPSKDKNSQDDIRSFESLRAEAMKKKEDDTEGEPEEDYYSCYDRFAIVQNYLEEVEPTLPPRPDHEIYKSLSGESVLMDSNGGKSEKKNALRYKIHQILKKTPSKELNESQEDTSPKKPKRRRSHSFLKALGFKYKKKERKPKTEIYDEDSEGEPEYESVDYELQAWERKLVQLGESENQHLQQMLPVNTMLELKHKQRERSMETRQSDEETELYEAILGMRGENRRPSTNSSHIEEKSITTSSSSKSSVNHEYATHNKLKKGNQPTSLVSVLPSLPPRRGHRPTSPWHDVPTNNSPVYGNGGLSPDPAVCRTRDKTPDAPFFLVQPDAEPKTRVNFPIVPDEILNTPEGFLHIQSHWRQAELARSWTREQQMEEFPGKERSKRSASLGREKTGINNSEEQLSIDNDSLREEGEETNSLNKCGEESQPDSLERREEKIRKGEKTCKDESNISNGTVHGKSRQTDTDNDSNVELRVQPQLRNGRDKSLPIQQEKCLEFQLVDFSTNGNNHHITNLSSNELHGHGILDNQEHNREIMSINRYSDELHLLLAQLAEITSAPLFNIGATKSLITHTTTTQSTLDEELGPIRRRRHSDPDYDIPRPHGSLQFIVQDAPDPSMSPDSLEPSMEGKHYLKDLC